MSGASADIVRRLTELERQVAEMKRMTRPYTAVRTRVYSSSPISVPSGPTSIALSFDTVRYDTAAMFDVTDPTRLTCQVAGLYALGGGIRWQTNGAGLRQMALVLNGGTNMAIQKQNANAAEPGAMTLVTMYELAVGDYIELFARQSSGGPLNIEAANAYSPEFWATRIV